MHYLKDTQGMSCQYEGKSDREGRGTMGMFQVCAEAWR